ncbi:MAG: class I SAM-dependent methyltransferase [Candidatus Binatota bacterium]|nr:class I SAM-dependent methyltransferase [Candidatus Binatota bacterium]
MRLKTIDNEREFDWGKTSHDYAEHRYGYPDSFYDVLTALGVGRPEQAILDLGTGTGVLARAFAKRGGRVTGIDIAANQIAMARKLAALEGLDITFQAAAAEDADFPDAPLDVISAGQSWLYFDQSVMIPKVLRLLKPDGCVVLTHLLWLPLQDSIAQQSEALVLQHNPDWKGAGYTGEMPPILAWTREHFDLRAFLMLYEPLAFTHETWRGRIRACRGVGASLSASEVERFDVEHRKLLEAIAPASFEVLHQMTLHVYRKKNAHA